MSSSPLVAQLAVSVSLRLTVVPRAGAVGLAAPPLKVIAGEPVQAGADARTAKEAAADFQPYVALQFGAKTPTSSVYVPAAWVPGVAHATWSVWLLPVSDWLDW